MLCNYLLDAVGGSKWRDVRFQLFPTWAKTEPWAFLVGNPSFRPKTEPGAFLWANSKNGHNISFKEPFSLSHSLGFKKSSSVFKDGQG